MQIIKDLNLNKNPKDVKSGSIVCAKNMMVDDTVSFLTNEYGFKIEFECPNVGEFIVGCIPCNTEICIFTYNYISTVSNIYRLKEDGSYNIIKSNWSYSGGKISGSYTYNYKGELILAVGEYDAKYKNGETINIPLKTWNVDNMTNKSLSYNVEEDVPQFTVKSNVSSNGSLISGVYTFFIRFKVDEASYTKWFQITDDIIIYNLVQKESPRHSYILEDVKSDADTNKFSVFELNDNALSNKNIVINLDFVSNTNYKEYQIGYIIKRNSEVLGRIENTYKISTQFVNIINNKYTAETQVDDFLEEPHQFYNVKNVINYNNRLYVANYSEYKNENLQDYANKIEAKLHLEKAGTVTKKETKKYHTATIVVQNPSTDQHDAYTIEGISTYVDDNGIRWINNPRQFVADYIAPIYTIVNNNGYHDKITNTIRRAAILADGSSGQQQLDYTLVLFDKNRTSTGYKQCNIFSTMPDAISNFGLKIEGNTIICVNLDTSVEFKLVEGGDCWYNIRYRSQFFNTSGGRVWDGSYWVYFVESKGNEILAAGYDIFGTIKETEVSYIINSDIAFNNNRTLIPGQVYAFYIHYIRKDLSCTNGFALENKDANSSISKVSEGGYFKTITTKDGKKLFMCPSVNPADLCDLIHPVFSNVEIPSDYIGFFISYEDIETTSIPVVCLRGDESGTYVSNTPFMYDEEPVFGDSVVTIVGDNYSTKSATVKEKNTNKYREPHIRILPRLKDTLTEGNIIGSQYRNAIVVTENSIYNKTTKTLYRLTQNIYKSIGNTETTEKDIAYMYVPGFYNNEKVVSYDKDIIANPTASNVLDPKGNPVGYAIMLHNYENYSQQPLNAYSLNQDYNYGAVSLVHKDGKVIGVYYNSVLSPDRLTNFLELKAAYKAKPSKTYTNYSKDYLDRFDKTIYRSDVISDESLVNGFRHFEINNYRNILENKGNIVNIVGIGLYLIVHTEHSIFVFDRTPKLTNKAQLDVPDVFDISYQELLPANEGFGGLSDKEESIITKHGYIWFDKVNKVIFRYENGKIDVISSNITNLLKKLNIYTVRFAEDVISQRLLICIYLAETYENDKHLSLTISYNFNTNTFISLHDYSFTNNYRTYNKSYLFDINKDRKRLYSYNESSRDFYNLKNDTGVFYPKYELKDL